VPLMGLRRRKRRMLRWVIVDFYYANEQLFLVVLLDD